MENTNSSRIYIGLGGNLPHPTLGPARHTLEAALAELGRRGVRVLRVSPWYKTAPVPVSDQPWYVNAVAEVATYWPADRLLAELHAVEDVYGRVRSVPNAARLVDIDLLDYKGEISLGGVSKATLPHPRMAARAFVLRPLADLASDWRHPISKVSIQSLIAALPADQVAEKL